MRLAAQVKLGFYPADEVAIEHLTRHLRLKPNDGSKRTYNIIDPCCGKGAAIKQIAGALEVDEKHVHTVELDAGRSAEARELMPEHQHLGPASYMGSSISACSFGLAYVNPPFDDELGGGRREEQAFAEQATRQLVSGGILALVCPMRALSGNRNFVQFLDSHYSDVCVYKFPEGHRPFNEIVVFGRKRSSAIPGDRLSEGKILHMNMHLGYVKIQDLPPLGEVQPCYWSDGRGGYEREKEVRSWEVPHSVKPTNWKKTKFTDEELLDAVERSPLGRLLTEVVAPPPESPPLPLDKGHLGLILASGMLDGVVQGPFGPHVVRASSHKAEYHNKEASESTMNPETGAVTTKDVFSQRMATVIRCVEQDGVIRTYSNDVSEKEEDAEAQSERSRLTV